MQSISFGMEGLAFDGFKRIKKGHVINDPEVALDDPAMRSALYQFCVFPLLRLLPPECAHRLALFLSPLWPLAHIKADPVLEQELWGLTFANPIGLAAGFDKDGKALSTLIRLGFGFLETGTVTPKPQKGNPKPRLFRSFPDQAIINRMGFNNEGVADMTKRLGTPRAFILGVNIGKNKDSTDDIGDYIAAAEAMTPYADYITINVSSPNTPGLRLLQAKDKLVPLLESLRPLVSSKPLLVKIAPDVEEEDIKAIADIALSGLCDGLIISNTTTARMKGLDPRFAREAGGLSGRPLFQPSTRLLAKMYQATQGKTVLIGAGGIEDARSAYAKIRAGASLLQLYSALIFKGPGLVGHILKELPVLLKADGFSHIQDAIGADHRRKQT